MFRLASALTRLLSMDPNSTAVSIPSSPVPRKPSIKSKPAWRSTSVHSDNRKCVFTATNALTAATKKEIVAYTSSEEIRSPTHRAISIERFKEDELTATCPRIGDRRSLGVHMERINDREMSSEELTSEIEDVKTAAEPEKAKEPENVKETVKAKESESSRKPKCAEETESSEGPSTSQDSEDLRRSSLKCALRKTSCTVDLDVYQPRRASGPSVRPRLNSLSTVSPDKLNTLREKFGTPDKVMHYFGRCFVKFFSNYG